MEWTCVLWGRVLLCRFYVNNGVVRNTVLDTDGYIVPFSML